MTRLDAAALHADLTRQITEARRHHTMARTDHLADMVDLYDQQVTTLVAADGWLRCQAFDRGHERGHSIHIDSLMTKLRLDLDEWLEYLDSETVRQAHCEHRFKTLRHLANDAHRFAAQPDPFPELVPPPRQGWLRGVLRRLVRA